MPAHLRDLTEPCQHPGCTKRADVELRNTYNARLGLYCRRHGAVALVKQRELDA